MSRRDEVSQEPQQQSGGRSIDTTECMCYLGKGGGGGVAAAGDGVQSLHLGLEMIREIRQTCFMASSNSTRSITAFVSLYSFRACKAQPS